MIGNVGGRQLVLLLVQKLNIDKTTENCGKRDKNCGEMDNQQNLEEIKKKIEELERKKVDLQNKENMNNMKQLDHQWESKALQHQIVWL